MNEIFLLLWASDFVGAVGIVGMILAISLSFGMVMCLIGSAMEKIDVAQVVKKYLAFAKWPLIFLCFSIITPSSTTIKALVAMRVGEYAIASPLGEKSVKALNAVLDRVIAEAGKK